MNENLVRELKWTKADSETATARGWNVINQHWRDRQIHNTAPAVNTNIVAHDMKVARRVVLQAIEGDALSIKACRAVSGNPSEVEAICKTVGTLTWLLALRSPLSETAPPDQPASAPPT